MMEKIDIKETMNNFVPATDASCIYIELADGSQGKIKKSDLVELMRNGIGIATPSRNGLIGEGDFFYKGLAKGKASELKSGIYGIYQGGVENVPITYGTIVVFGTKSEYYNFWIATDSLAGVMYMGAENLVNNILLK